MSIAMDETVHEKDKISGLIGERLYVYFLVSIMNRISLKSKDLLGGDKTLHSSILILLHFLSKYPECQERIFEEAKMINDEFSFKNLYEAHFTRAVIWETFRLFPAAFALARYIESDIELSGYHVKAGVREFYKF